MIDGREHIGWTSVDQAKRLNLANVNPDSADMSYFKLGNQYVMRHIPSGAVRYRLFSYHEGYELPCWSLGALLQLIPKQIVLYGVTFYMALVANEKHQWSICYANPDVVEPFFSFEKETIVEACIEMITALKVAEKEGKVIASWPEVNEEGGEE